MVGINLSTSANKNQPSVSPKRVNNYLSYNGTGAAQGILSGDRDSVTISFSQEAKKLLEDKVAEKQKMLQEAVENLRAKSKQLEELQKSKKENLAKKIAETKARLKELVDRMRQAMLFGDKRTAALLAKEAGKLAKELAHAIKDSGVPDTGDSVSIPIGDFSEGSEETSGANESVAAAENLEDIEEPENIDPEAAGQTAVAEEAMKEAEKAGMAEDTEQENKTDQANQTNKIREAVNNALAKTNFNPVAGHEKDLKEIVAYLRAIASMARGIMKQKTSVASNPPDGSHQDNKIQMETEKANKETESAIKEIEEAIGSIKN